MLDKHIQKTKIHFSVGVLLLLATIISGINIFNRVPYFSYDYLMKELKYVQYTSLLGIPHVYGSAKEESAQSVPVLVYHGLVGESANGKDLHSGEGINISPEQFYDQMLALKEAGWNTVSIYDFQAFMEGKKELPKKSFLLTFDDGRKDSYYPADPVLRALGFRATMFVIANKSLGDSRRGSVFYLSESELKEMKKSGRWDLQSHGKLDHDSYDVNQDGQKGNFLSNRLWKSEEGRLETVEEYQARIAQDLAESKREIEQELEVSVVGFAYPFSDYGGQSVNVENAEAQVIERTKAVYPLAFYQVSSEHGLGFNYPFYEAQEKRPLVKRLKFAEPLTGEELVKYLNTSLEKHLSFRDTFQSDQGWYRTWGEVRVENELLSVGASDSSTGGAVFLDGSQAWQDYRFTVTASRVEGESVTLLARYADEKNFVECTYSDKYVRLVGYINCEKKVTKEVRRDIIFPSTRLGIQVKGQDGQCLVNDEAVISERVESALPRGMVGIKTWDKEEGKSVFEISEAYISPARE